MTWNFIKPILLFIPLAALQLVLLPLVFINDIGPNIIVILICFFTLKYGQLYGTLLGFVLGFLLDLISANMLGAFMLSFTIAGFIAGYFFNENKIEINTASFAFVFIVSLCAILSSFIYTAVASSNSDINIFYLIIEGGILPGLYTAFFSLPVVILNSKREIK